MWSTTVLVANQQVNFKVDTGAEVTALSETTWKLMEKRPELQKTRRIHCGPDQQPLKILGKMSTTLQLSEKECTQTVFVLRGLKNNLLGLPAIKALGLIQNIEN